MIRTMEFNHFSTHLKTVYPELHSRLTEHEWQDTISLIHEFIEDPRVMDLEDTVSELKRYSDDGYDNGYNEGWREAIETAISALERV